MKKDGLRIVDSMYKDEKPCSELALLIVKEFITVTATPNKFWSERELREKVDRVIMTYFKKSGKQHQRDLKSNH